MSKIPGVYTGTAMIDQFHHSPLHSIAPLQRFKASDFLHREVRERLLERLLAIVAEPTWIVDLGAGTGGATPGLKSRFPECTDTVDRQFATRCSRPGRRRNCLSVPTPRSLPLADSCNVDLVVSNLMLHHCPDPTARTDRSPPRIVRSRPAVADDISAAGASSNSAGPGRPRIDLRTSHRFSTSRTSATCSPPAALPSRYSTARH